MISMALTAAALPLAIVPFLFLMNDPIYLGKHRNGWISNTVVEGRHTDFVRPRDHLDSTRDHRRLI